MGNPQKPFHLQEALDKEIPYLLTIFVMCMERLNQVIEETIFDNKWKPFKIHKNEPLLSNLFFAMMLCYLLKLLLSKLALLISAWKGFVKLWGKSELCKI